MNKNLNEIKTKNNIKLKFILLAGLLILVMVASLFGGRYHMEFGDVLKLIEAKLSGASYPGFEVAEHVLFQVRLPRILIALLVGAGLSIAGASLQGLFQNPLVSPDILGVCSGSGFGAALGILLTSGMGVMTTVLSLAFGLISMFLTLFMVRSKGQTLTMSYILSGIIVTSVFSALTSLIKYVADVNDQLPAITFWLMGSFANTEFNDLKIIILPIIIGIAGLLLLRWQLNILSLGEEEAYSLGVNPQAARIAVILFSTIITAACVMVSGIVGWVGLVIPHISRRIMGVNHKGLLPASMLLGGIFMVIVDSVARNLTAAEIPIGILTALIGAPFFALIYNRMKGES
ncbi:FecCD family ABC transporter permease [Lacrimispora amygdalina]|uniref:FecCD family ABC transporter permease n=2 Tax=Lacrimispora TaxID=2719231 RepID=UPI000BE30A2A|nr:iron ABC transporter permease [Lacrimispora amygdalina]